MKEIWPQLRERWKGALKRYQYVLLVMAAGVLLMMLPMGPSGGSEEAQGPPEGVVPLYTLTPQFQGALVVCPGGGDPAVQLRLLEAVSALTGLGSDRISICEGN